MKIKALAICLLLVAGCASVDLSAPLCVIGCDSEVGIMTAGPVARLAVRSPLCLINCAKGEEKP